MEYLYLEQVSVRSLKLAMMSSYKDQVRQQGFKRKGLEIRLAFQKYMCVCVVCVGFVSAY